LFTLALFVLINVLIETKIHVEQQQLQPYHYY